MIKNQFEMMMMMMVQSFGTFCHHGQLIYTGNLHPSSTSSLDQYSHLLITCQSPQDKVTKFGEHQSLECEAEK